jgi:hypothetical protein
MLSVSNATLGDFRWLFVENMDQIHGIAEYKIVMVRRSGAKACRQVNCKASCGTFVAYW